jgi:hypothetical protein
MAVAIAVYIFSFINVVIHLNIVYAKLIYNPGQQFPLNSEYLKMPSTILISVFMGQMHYSYFNLTLHSIRSNPTIDFMIIHIVSASTESSKYFKQFNIPSNLQIESVTFYQFSQLVQHKLNLTIHFNIKWYYKMCDYKPTLAYLFSNVIENRINTFHHSDNYSFWGYADLDLIWGNISRFAYLFQGNNTSIPSSSFQLLHYYINTSYT